MRILIPMFVVLSVIGGWVVGAQEKKAPAKLVFEAKNGNVTFDHPAHVKRAKDDCKVCHEKLFPQEKAPLGWKAGMHKPAETAKTSCGFCHHPGGMSFGVTGNCAKCHKKA